MKDSVINIKKQKTLLLNQLKRRLQNSKSNPGRVTGIRTQIAIGAVSKSCCASLYTISDGMVFHQSGKGLYVGDFV